MKQGLLRALRTQSRMSVTAAAAKLGVSRQTVHAWERGAAVPVGANVRALIELYQPEDGERLLLLRSVALGESLGAEDAVFAATASSESGA